MLITADIIKDSVAPSGSRLTTYVLTYPRFIHSEFMTHRMFSKNASSSRAIPLKKQIEMIKTSPVVPKSFTKNVSGMQGGEPLIGQDHENATTAWLQARDLAVQQAEILGQLNVHKQYVNRILEPFMHITVVCSATDYNNFFALRYHPDAQPDIQELARCRFSEYTKSNPVNLSFGQWHLPFIDEKDLIGEDFKESNGLTLTELNIRRSVARCARVSYLNHDKSMPTIEQDLNLYDRLVGSRPGHFSPTEHQAMATTDLVYSGNLKGWLQFRKTLNQENVNKFIKCD